MKKPKFRNLVVGVFVLGIAFLAGLAVPDHYVSRGVAKAIRIAATLRNGDPEAETVTGSFSSIFVGLEAEIIEVPRTEKGRGGALTSFGDELIVLRWDGQIFTVKDGAVRSTEIRGPENGLSAYMSDAQSKYSEMTHVFTAFRYNDILYARNENGQYLFLSYTEYLAESECYGNTIAKLELAASTQSITEIAIAPEDWSVIFRSQPCLPLKSVGQALEGHMAGGRVDFQAPNKIILGSGEYHWDGIRAPRAIAQDDDFDYGKVITINIDTGDSTTLSRGHRNMQGVVVADDGQIWVTGHGARGGDELNRVKRGADYGWPATTLGTRYNTLPWPTEGRYGHHDGAYEKPVYAWLPSIATSGLTQISGFHEAWDGDLLISTFASRGLSRVRIVDGRALFAEDISIGERIRYVQQHTDGRIALWTDSSKVMLLSPAKAGYGNDYIEGKIEYLSLAERESSELRMIVDGCLECHDLSGSNADRPSSLAMMHGKPLGENAISSPALRAAGGQWTQTHLSDFIECPECVVPGTFMQNQNLSSEQAGNVASLLKMFAEDFQ